MKNRAFTLVELLVVMVLLALLSGMTAAMLASAKTDALTKKTGREVDVIEQILLSRMSEMGFSPVPLVFPVANGTPVANSGRLRLMARRDQLRMAFPDRRADLLHPPTALKYSTGTAYTANKIQPPAAWARMRAKLGLDRPAALPPTGADIGEGEVLPGGAYQIWGLRDTTNAATHVVPTPGAGTTELPQGTDPSTFWTLEHESAECLYLILAVTEFNGTPALDLLGQQYIANTDNDLVPEIVDGWGRPLGFVRWPIGTPQLDIQTAGPDGFDYLRSDHRFNETPTNTTNDPINLTPMIVSSGADREFGIRLAANPNELISRNKSYATTMYVGPPAISGPPDYFYPDPFFNWVGSNNDLVAARTGGGMGAVLDRDTAADNITNFGR